MLLLFGNGDPFGSEKQSATASPSFGGGMPRFFMSSFASRRSLPSDMYLKPTERRSECRPSLSGIAKRPRNAVFKLTLIPDGNHGILSATNA